MAITKVNDVIQYTDEAGTRRYAPPQGAGDPSQSSASNGSTVAVASSATPVTIKAANANRVAVTVANDSTAILYILLGAGTVSATNYTYAIPAKGTTAADRTISGYTGIITGIWSAANGNALVTELT